MRKNYSRSIATSTPAVKSKIDAAGAALPSSIEPQNSAALPSSSVEAQRKLPLLASVRKRDNGGYDGGYVPVSHKIFGYLRRVPIPSALILLFWNAFHERYRWHEEDKPFSISDLRKWAPTIDRRIVFRDAKKLVNLGMFVITGDDKSEAKYRIQHDPRKWKAAAPRRRGRASSRVMTETSSPMMTKASSPVMTQSLYEKKEKEIEKKPPYPPATLELFKQISLARIIPDNELIKIAKENSPEEFEAICRERAAR